MNRSTLPLLLLLATFFITDCVLAAPEQKTRFAGSYEVVEDTTVYRSPSETAEQIASIPAGTRVNVFSDHGDWIAIFSRHGRPPGYIKKSSLVKSESSFSRKADPPNATSSSGASPNNGQGLSKVNRSIGSYEVIEDTTVYSSPSENSRQVASISSGTMVDVVLFLSKWVRILSREGRPSGYIKRSSLAITEPSSSKRRESPNQFSIDPTSLRSQKSHIKTEIKFDNHLPIAFAIYWLDYEGNEIFSGDLDPRSSKVIETFIRHSWRVRDKKTKELVKAVVVTTLKPVVSIDIPIHQKRKDEREEDRVYIQQLKQSLPLHGPRYFFGWYESKPVYEAYFKRTFEGCFKIDGLLSAFVDAFKTPTMTFCDPPGTVTKFHAVREGRSEPEIAVFTIYNNQKTEMWFRTSKFRPYGEVSFKEVDKEKTLSPEALKAIKNLQLLLAFVLVGIVGLFIFVASSGGGISTAGAGPSPGGGGGGSEDTAIGKITHSSSKNELIGVETHKITDGKHTGYGYSEDQAKRAFEIARDNNLKNYTIPGKGFI